MWKVDRTFFALLHAPEAVRPYIPDFRYHLNDFSHLSSEEIRGEIWLRVVLSIFRRVFDPDLREELEALITLLFQLAAQQTGLAYIRTVLLYLSRASTRLSRHDLQRVLLKQGETGEKLMSTIAQEFIQQGMQQGMQQGLQQGLQQGMQQGIIVLRQNVLELLSLRFGVPAHQFQGQLNHINDLDRLSVLLRRAATVLDVSQFEQVLDIVLQEGHD